MRILSGDEIEQLKALRNRLVILEAILTGVYGNWWIEIFKNINNSLHALIFQLSIFPLAFYIMNVIGIKKRMGRITFFSMPFYAYVLWIAHLIMIYLPLYLSSEPTREQLIYSSTGFFLMVFILIIGRKICELTMPVLK